MKNTALLLWSTTKLSTLNYLNFTKFDINVISDLIKSDGCTNVTDLYFPACVVHDFWYSYHLDFDGTEISKQEADKRFRKYMQKLSPFGIFSPMSWWRWVGVKAFGKKFWDN